MSDLTGFEADSAWLAESEACSVYEDDIQVDLSECACGAPTFSSRVGHAVVTECSRSEKVLARSPVFY